MNKAEMTAVVARTSGLPESCASAIVGDLFNAIAADLARGHPVRLEGIGTLAPRAAAQRLGRNLHTGERLTIPAGTKLKFSIAKAMRGRLR